VSVYVVKLLKTEYFTYYGFSVVTYAVDLVFILLFLLPPLLMLKQKQAK